MDKQKIKKYILEKIKLGVFVLLGFLIGATISIYFSYANGNQGLLGELFYLKDNKPYMSGALAFEDGAIPAGKIAGKLELSQLPDGFGGDAKTLSGRTVSSMLDNSDAKIPTNKAVMDKISPLLNCTATTVNGYSIPLTSAMQLTSSISKIVTTANGSYVLTQQFKCNNGSFETYGTETKSNVLCSATTVDGYSVTSLIGGNSVNRTKTLAGTNGIITYQRTFSCSTDSILTYGSETAISISCNAGYKKDSNTVCSITPAGYYTTAGMNTPTICSNVPANGNNNNAIAGQSDSFCLWQCNANYLKNGSVCLLGCSYVSIGQKCFPSWSDGTLYKKYSSTQVMHNCNDSWDYHYYLSRSGNGIQPGCTTTTPSGWTVISKPYSGAATYTYVKNF